MQAESVQSHARNHVIKHTQLVLLQVPALLTGSYPSQVHFANRVSCHMYKDFVRESLQSLKVVGALSPWEGKGPPVVISGLGVVKNRKGELRLILDCRYLNLFLKYSKVK